MRATGATRHGNRHSVVKLDKNVAFVVNLLLAEAPFQEVLGQESGENDETKSADLFQQETAALISCKPLSNSLQQARGNWVCGGPRRSQEGQKRGGQNKNGQDNRVQADGMQDGGVQDDGEQGEDGLGDLFDDNIADLVDRGAGVSKDEDNNWY